MIGIEASGSQGYAKSRKIGESESEKGSSFFQSDSLWSIESLV